MTRVVDLDEAVVVVTGGASGIGRGIVDAFRERGSTVVVADRDQQALDAVSDELGVMGVVTDVADPESVLALADAVLAAHGKVHVVCNNAGVGPMAPVEHLTLDDWRWMIDVNLWGVVHGVHTFLPLLRRNTDFGHIVNTASMSVVSPAPNLAPYVAAKAGVLGLTEVVALELQATDSVVGATALVPGPVTTNIKNSLRNRPGGAESGLQDVDLAANRPDFAFMEPLTVGRMVVDAVVHNEPFVATHADFRDRVAARHRRILAGFPAS